MSDSLSVGRRRAKGSWLPRLTGAGLVVVLAAGAVALVYAHNTGASGPAPPGPGPSTAQPARVASTQTVGLIAFGPYDDKDLYLNDIEDHPLMLKPVGAVVEYLPIPPGELMSGVPQWTADQMADGSYIFIYTPTGRCLGVTADKKSLALVHCQPVISQRWRSLHVAKAVGQQFSAYASAWAGTCLTAPATAGPALLAPCGPVRTKSQEVAFWWSL
jgi:hypothetical protein